MNYGQVGVALLFNECDFGNKIINYRPSLFLFQFLSVLSSYTFYCFVSWNAYNFFSVVSLFHFIIIFDWYEVAEHL